MRCLLIKKVFNHFHGNHLLKRDIIFPEYQQRRLDNSETIHLPIHHHHLLIAPYRLESDGMSSTRISTKFPRPLRSVNRFHRAIFSNSRQSGRPQVSMPMLICCIKINSTIIIKISIATVITIILPAKTIH